MRRFIKKMALLSPPFKRFYESREKLSKALDERTEHYEQSVKRNIEVETELKSLHIGNLRLMEELQLLKSKKNELSDMYDRLVEDKWANKTRKTNKICQNPFTRIEVMETGEVYTCCPAYLKPEFSIGNVYTDEIFEDIWNSENAMKLRYSVANGDFEYCGRFCKWLHYDNGTGGINSNPIIEKENTEFDFDNYKECRIDRYPQIIALSCDESCNLYCPTCRTKKKVFSYEANKRLSDMLEKIIRPALKDCKALNLLGSGEFFISKPIQEFCKSLTKEEFPELKISIITNGQLFTKERWMEFENLKEMIGGISVSVDAACKETYEKIRLGANWERLTEALNLLSDMRKRNEIEIFKVTFVVQKDNFKQIPDFVHMGKRLDSDSVEFQRINNWGTFKDDEFLLMDVFDTRNENRKEAVKLLRSVLSDREIKVEQNIL